VTDAAPPGKPGRPVRPLLFLLVSAVAAAAFSRARALYPWQAFVADRGWGRMLVERGGAELKAGKARAAAATLAEGAARLRLVPDSAEARREAAEACVLLARALDAAGRPDEARTRRTEARRIDSGVEVEERPVPGLGLLR